MCSHFVLFVYRIGNKLHTLSILIIIIIILAISHVDFRLQRGVGRAASNQYAMLSPSRIVITI